MFDLLRKFMADVSSAPSGEPEFAGDDYRLATAALLVHVANVDGSFDDFERVRLRQIVEERFGLDEQATARLIARAETTDREAVDFFHFTHVLKTTLDEDGRHKIIEMMWDMVFADGEVTAFEENVVWRVAELLGVSNRDRIMLRRKVADEPRPEPGRPEQGRPEPGRPEKDRDEIGAGTSGSGGSWSRGTRPAEG